VVDRPGEHPRELGGANAGLERRQLRFGFGDHLFVALRRAELDENAGVLDVACQLLDAADLLLETGAPSGDDLRLLLVVPEPGSERLLLQLVNRGLQLRKVKDAPLAP
jgi:hypothetical protein